MTTRAGEGTPSPGRSSPDPGEVTRLRPQEEARAGRTRVVETRHPAGLRLDRHHRDRASLTLVRDLAAEADIHPTCLTRPFKRAYGFTVTGYVRHLRERETVRLMAAGSDSLGRVAQAAGIADKSQMCRVFKREAGLTPGRSRRLL